MVTVQDALQQTIGVSRPRFAEWIDSVRTQGKDREWGLEQTRICAELAGLGETDPAFAPLVAAFVLIAAYQAEMDRQIDGQFRRRSDLPSVTGSFAVAQEILYPLILARSGPDAMIEFTRLLTGRAVDHAFALRSEVEDGGAGAPYKRSDVAARSNVAILGYESACFLAGTRPDPRVLALFEKFLYLMQVSDDLEDWQDDLAAGRPSILLNRFTPEQRVFEKVAEALFIDGMLFEVAGEIIQEVDELAAGLAGIENLRHSGMDGYLAVVRGHWRSRMRDVEQTTRTFLAGN